MAAEPDEVETRVAWFEVLVDPAFESVRYDPRFLALMEGFGL